jgi:protein-L-isoaspartate(D-aspartate) O-methyltransferase
VVRKRANMDEVRRRYARLMATASKSNDPRLERAFAIVPREAFLPPGPWRIWINNSYFETPSADPVYLYQNALVALDVSKRINNGEPFLHATWIGAVAPSSGETICHVGAGTGYYTALLSVLALPGGRVQAFEIDEILAARARKNLEPFEGVTVVRGDATILPMPPSDLIYVNAGVTTPPLSWLQALRPNGRMIIPWRPAETIGLAVIISRRDDAFQVAPLMAAWFIPCVGASGIDGCTKVPNTAEAWSARSAWLTCRRPPDETAVAIYQDVWFSSGSLPPT